MGDWRVPGNGWPHATGYPLRSPQPDWTQQPQGGNPPAPNTQGASAPTITFHGGVLTLITDGTVAVGSPAQPRVVKFVWSPPPGSTPRPFNLVGWPETIEFVTRSSITSPGGVVPRVAVARPELQHVDQRGEPDGSASSEPPTVETLDASIDTRFQTSLEVLSAPELPAPQPNPEPTPPPDDTAAGQLAPTDLPYSDNLFWGDRNPHMAPAPGARSKTVQMESSASRYPGSYAEPSPTAQTERSLSGRPLESLFDSLCAESGRLVVGFEPGREQVSTTTTTTTTSAADAVWRLDVTHDESSPTTTSESLGSPADPPVRRRGRKRKSRDEPSAREPAAAKARGGKQKRKITSTLLERDQEVINDVNGVSKLFSGYHSSEGLRRSGILWDSNVRSTTFTKQNRSLAKSSLPSTIDYVIEELSKSYEPAIVNEVVRQYDFVKKVFRYIDFRNILFVLWERKAALAKNSSTTTTS